MPTFTATVSVGQKKFNARTNAATPSEAAYKIAAQAATRFPAQKAVLGMVLEEDSAVTKLRNIFKI